MAEAGKPLKAGKDKTVMKKLMNHLCVLAAFLCLGAGCIGIVLPILPTTPFLIAALALFAKGSERFHRWFLSTGLYKKYLEDFVVTKSMTMAAKVKVLALVSALLTVGFVFSPLPAKLVIAMVAVFHYIYFLFGIKTARKRAGFAEEEA